jgi:hypothetical protein
MGRPAIGTAPMTAAQRQRRHRAAHPHKPDPGAAGRQRRFRDRRATMARAETAAELMAAKVAMAAVVADPLYVQAAAILEDRGDTELVGKLMASWPYMATAVREQLAMGKGARFWLKD